MTTSIDVANRAIGLLGGRPITSFTEESNEARIAKAMYLSTRDTVLRAYPWASLKRRAALAKLAENPISGFAHQFQLPSDCLRVLEVHNVERLSDQFWEVNGDLILTDEAKISIVYLSSKVPEDKMSSHLVQALAYHLASEMAYAMTGSNQAQVNFNNLYQQILMEARTTDSLEQSYKRIGPRNFERVRL